MSILSSNHRESVDNSCNGTTQKDPATVAKALAVLFAAKDVHFKPAAINGNRALAIAYVDARAIQERLDSVLGMDGWQDEYTCLPNGSVVCTLRVRINDEWIAKIDVGSPSAQSDEGDRVSSTIRRPTSRHGPCRSAPRARASWQVQSWVWAGRARRFPASCLAR